MEKNKSHKYFLGEKDFDHSFANSTGILLINLGTPDQPTTKALRKYLREFLSDPRIIELPKIFWQILLNGVILFSRPPKVAKLYKSIWTDQGSPLLVITNSIALKLRNRLALRFQSPHVVEVGMRYGNPSIKAALRKLKERSCRRIIVLPLFGQYSSATVGSAMDAVFSELSSWRWVPEIRSINQFHDEAGYISTISNNIRAHWDVKGQADKLLISFHGMPKRYVEAGDPYFCHCQKTARLIAENLGIRRDRYEVSFQSQFGKEEWIGPATDKTLESWARLGLKSVDVICPGFIADCLETLEEIEEQNKEIFLHNGGTSFSYIKAVNDDLEFIKVLEDLIAKNGEGWLSENNFNKSLQSSEVKKHYENFCRGN